MAFKLSKSPPPVTDIGNLNGCFNCNICLDSARDPVVTLCGHLYCWPCIYKWFHVQSSSMNSHEYPQCPVCKAEISDTTMVPLYGRGQTPDPSALEGKPLPRGIAIPPRPPAYGTRALLDAVPEPCQQLQYSNPQSYHPHSYGSRERVVSSSPLFSQGSNAIASQSPYAYPNSYSLMGSSSPRLRRQEMQAEKSLTRISLFLLWLLLFCLFLF